MAPVKTLLINYFVFLSCIGIAQEYNFIHYSVQEGLPQSQAFDIYQDHHAYIWIATQGGGVGRFDGINFNAISSRNGLPSNYVNVIYGDQYNRIIFGTKSGIAVYQDEAIIKTIDQDINVTSIVAKNDSTLWVGSTAGLYTLKSNTLALEKLQIDRRVNAHAIHEILIDRGITWLATSNGLYRTQSATDDALTPIDGLTTRDIKSIAIDSIQQLWVLQYDGGLSVIELANYDITNHFDQSSILRGQSVEVIKDDIWIGTQDKGVIRYTPKTDKWTQITEAHGLRHNNIKAVMVDQNANVWLASSGGGISKYIGQYFTHYNRSNGLPGNRIYSILSHHDGSILLSIDTDGLTRIDSSGIQSNIDSSLINVKCTDIYQDQAGRLWISTAGEGILLKDSTTMRSYTTENGLPSDWIRSVRQDKSGSLWIGTYANGLARISAVDSTDISVELYDRKKGISDLYITSLSISPEGDLWYSTKKGNLGYISAKGVQNHNNEQGLPKVEIRSMVFDSLQNIWIGTAGKGLYKGQYLSDNPVYERVAESEQLSSENIYSMLYDNDLNLWIGTEKGVDKIELNESGSITDVQHFGKNEGFLGIETCHNSVAKDQSGNLWFGTLNGLTQHKPNRTEIALSNPILHFEHISIKNKALDRGAWQTENQLLRHNENDLNLRFKAIHIDQPKGILYRWRLNGLNSEWTEWTRSPSTNYYNLPPGEYEFEASAKGIRGQESNVIQYKFRIDTAIWQRLWFKLTAAGALSLIAISLIRNRILSIRTKEEEKRKKLQLQNELLTLEQKALQLQMNPHFIFNALNSIQGLIVTNKNTVARDQIQNFAALMRGILSNSKKTTITLAEEYTTLDQYLSMEQFCQREPFSYTIHLPRDIDPDEIDIPPMIIQPFAENAVIHGISHLDSKGVISIDFSIEEAHIKCIITDNGVGRDKAASLKMKTQKKDHESSAITIATKRLNALQKDQPYESIIIKDLKNPQGKATGTQVVIRLPYHHNY